MSNVLDEFKGVDVPNVFGIETEYSCLVRFPGDRVHEYVGACHSVDHQLGLHDEPIISGMSYFEGNERTELKEAINSLEIFWNNETGMMSNGARFYLDPSGPEYATPETSTAEEAVHRMFDGDEILLRVFEYLRKKEVIEGYQVNRRNTDHNRTSRGVHINTFKSMLGFYPEDSFDNLAALNIAKGAIFGSGGLLVDENGETAFHHSPRLSLTNKFFGDNYFDRPLIRLPDKKDGNYGIRIETVTSDALNFAWPMRASIVMTNVMVRMLEQRVGGLPVLRDSMKEAGVVGRYGNERTIQAFKNGCALDCKPTDILVAICERALKEDGKLIHLDGESVQVLQEVITVSDLMKSDPLSAAGDVESIARLIAMKKKMDKEGLTLDSERMCRFDYAWDWLGGGIAERLRQKNLAGWRGFSHTHSRDETKKRLTVPPQDTRAKARGNVLKVDKGGTNSGWSHIEIRNGDGIPNTDEYGVATVLTLHPLDNGDRYFK